MVSFLDLSIDLMKLFYVLSFWKHWLSVVQPIAVPSMYLSGVHGNSFLSCQCLNLAFCPRLDTRSFERKPRACAYSDLSRLGLGNNIDQALRLAAHCRAISNYPCISLLLVCTSSLTGITGIPARLFCTLVFGVEHHLPQCLEQ